MSRRDCQAGRVGRRSARAADESSARERQPAAVVGAKLVLAATVVWAIVRVLRLERDTICRCASKRPPNEVTP